MLNRLRISFGWLKVDETGSTSTTGSDIVPSQKTLKRSHDKVSHYLGKGTFGDERRRTNSETLVEMKARKRTKLSGDAHRQRTPDSDLASYKASPLGSPTADKSKTSDRRLMPPPAIPKTRKSRRSIGQTPSPRVPVKRASEEDDTQSINSELSNTSTRHRPNGLDRFEAERAQRYADACNLPANSGIWSSTEHELFIHLAMRGYDPLLPQNWMRDFRTLPIALFAHLPDDLPLITPMYDTEFRAIRALRDLFETGKLIRDKVISSPGFDIEYTLLRAIKQYMDWAMNDVRIYPLPNVLPLHRIAVRKKGQRTSDLINELEDDLYNLAQQHRDEKGILPSIEFDTTNRNTGDPAVTEDPEGLPTLTGLMITYSLVYLFTFNPNIKKVKAEPGSNPDDEEMGIRYIERFDFSDAGMDVWNALSVAIVCMMLRNEQDDRCADVGTSEQIAAEWKRKDRGTDPDL